MTLADDISKIELEVVRLRAENQRLQAESWQHNDAIRLLAREKESLESERKKVGQLLSQVHGLRQAIRHQQSLRRNKGRVRHIPGNHELKRAKYCAFDGWINKERIFLKHWRDENRRKPGTNGGCGLLELLLSEVEGPVDICQRDATVAATVIQWLGTNCGQGFLHEVQKEYDLKDAADRKKRAQKAVPA